MKIVLIIHINDVARLILRIIRHYQVKMSKTQS